MTSIKSMQKAQLITIFLVTILIITGVLVIPYFIVASRTDMFTGRWVAWKSSAVDDYLLFPYHTINHSPSVFTFSHNHEGLPIKDITYQVNGKPQTKNLDTLLEKTGTTAFLVIKGDTIFYENYFNGYQRDSIVTSFSIAKSLTSLMIGMAIEDGYIQSIDDPVTQYIPELSQVDPNTKISHWRIYYQ